MNKAISSRGVSSFFGRFLGFLVQCHMLTLLPFFRKGFGETVIQPFHVLGGGLMIGFYSLAYGLWMKPLLQLFLPTSAPPPTPHVPFHPSMFGQAKPPPTVQDDGISLMGFFAVAAMVMMVVHGREHWKRFLTFKFIRRLSYSWGKPRIRCFFPKTPLLHLRIFVEPAGLIALGILVYFIDDVFGFYLVLGGFALFNTEWFLHAMFRERIMSVLDAQIIGEMDAKTLAEQVIDPEVLVNNPQFVEAVQDAWAENPDQDIDLDTILRRLDPKLRDLIDPVHPPKPPSPEDRFPAQEPSPPNRDDEC